MRYSSLVLLACAFCAALPRPARGEGEAISGFPNWAERVLHEWTNRARSDPQVEMTTCGANCGDAACYSPVAPLGWDPHLAHSSRFHTDNMIQLGFFDATSACTLVGDIGTLYPDSCDGSASCACVGGVATCNPACTTWDVRIALFGGAAEAENLTAYDDPDAAFYSWLYEDFPTSMQPPNCSFVPGPPTNGHRWNLLMSSGFAGAGIRSSGARATLDIGSDTGSGSSYKIPSAAHYPQQSASVDAWANWYDASGPSVAKIDLDGTCSDMTLDRGSQTNGAWHSVITTAGSGCHHYVFAFKDNGGAEVLYPTTGALTIGDGSALCPDFSRAPPPGCAGFDRIFANGYDP